MGTRERRARELAERKQLILDESRKLFFEKGYENVSIQDICNAVEYGRSALYDLFKSKEEIYSYIYLEGLERLADILEAINPEPKDFDTEFLRCVDLFCDFFEKHRPYYDALFHFNSSAPAYSTIPPHILERKEEARFRAGARAAALIQNAMEQGSIRTGDVEELLNLYWASTAGVINSFLYKEAETEKQDIRRACRLHAEIYLAGVKRR